MIDYFNLSLLILLGAGLIVLVSGLSLFIYIFLYFNKRGYKIKN